MFGIYCSILRSEKGRASAGILAPKVTSSCGDGLEFRGRFSEQRVFPVSEIGWIFGVPLPPQISGIIELPGKLEIIYGAQAVTGKILSL